KIPNVALGVLNACLATINQDRDSYPFKEPFKPNLSLDHVAKCFKGPTFAQKVLGERDPGVDMWRNAKHLGLYPEKHYELSIKPIRDRFRSLLHLSPATSRAGCAVRTCEQPSPTFVILLRRSFQKRGRDPGPKHHNRRREGSAAFSPHEP